MAKIQQPFSTATYTTGSILSDASASAFSGGSAAYSIAHGLDDIASGIVQNKRVNDAKAEKLKREQEIAAEKAAALAEKEKSRQDNLWLNKALSTYSRGLTDFETTPENQSRTDYLPAWMDKADSDANSLVETAPSEEAAEAFREKARQTIDVRYSRSAARTANNQMNSDLGVLQDTWGQTLSSYHQLEATDPHGASGNLLEEYANGIESIHNLYGDVSPEISRKLSASRTEDTAMALADKNPELAKNIVVNSPYLDESARKTLLSQIDKKKEEVSLVVKEDFGTVREKAVIAAQKNGTKTEIPLEDYKAIYPEEQAIVMKRRDDNKISASVTSHEFVKSLSGNLPSDKQKKATDFEKELDTEDKLTAYANVVQPALVRDQQLFDSDSVQWLVENNQQVQLFAKEITALENSGANDGITVDGNPGVLPPLDSDSGPRVPDPNLSAAARGRYYAAVLKYQGSPGEGDDPTRFMNKPVGMRTILTNKQAEYYANQINSGTIDNAVETINGILQQFPTDELRTHAISDLINLPTSKIKPEYQIAFQNANEPWLSNYIGAIKSAGDLTSMSVIDGAKIKTLLASNSVWNSFKNSISGPQSQRAGELSGYFNAIETYAKTKVAGGMSVKDAANEAISQLLTSTMAPVKISSGRVESFPFGWTNHVNQELWLPKEMFGRRLSDAELVDYGRRMGAALRDINPGDVDPSQFPAYSQLSDKYKGAVAIAKQISETGQYYPDPGGLTYHLTVATPEGKRIDLRNKDGLLFQLPLEKIPKFTKFENGEEWPDYVQAEKWRKPRQANGWPPTGRYWNFTK